MTYARSENGVVVQVLRVDPASVFGPSFAALFRVAPDDVEVGWSDDGEAFSPPAQSLEQMKSALREAVAAQWAQHAARGVAYAFPDGSSDVIQTRTLLDTTNVTGMVVAAQELKAQGVTDAVLGFRGESNVTHPLTPQQMIDMGMAVQGATVATYGAKWAHDAAIDALTTVEAARAYDVTTGWPE